MKRFPVFLRPFWAFWANADFLYKSYEFQDSFDCHKVNFFVCMIWTTKTNPSMFVPPITLHILGYFYSKILSFQTPLDPFDRLLG